MIITTVIYLIKIWSLPSDIGVHFGPSGEFDVIANKWFSLYPFLVGYGTLLVMKFFQFLIKKIKSGLKVTENGEENLKLSANLLTSAIAFIVCVFFSYWAFCVLNQTPLNIKIGAGFAISIMIVFPIFIISVIVIRIVNSKNKSHPKG